MRKLSPSVVSLWLALTGVAAAQEVLPFSEVPNPPAYGSSASPARVFPVPSTVNNARIRIGMVFLAMLLGKTQGTDDVLFLAPNAATAYGLGATFVYDVIGGVSVGVAPQAVFNVKATNEPGSGAIEYDLLARVAYTRPMTRELAIYAEVLPGYSIISLPSHLANVQGRHASDPTGFLVVFGGGATMDIGDRYFVNLGIGFQLGLQKGSLAGTDFDYRTKFVRVAVGGDLRL